MSDIKFHLGTFSLNGGDPYAGIVIKDRVIAIKAAYNLYRAKYPQRTLQLTDIDSLLGILDKWETNFPSLCELTNFLIKENEDALTVRQSFMRTEELHIHAPILLPRQVFCTGVNYPQHVKEMQGGLQNKSHPKSRENHKPFHERRPYAFIRLSSTVNGPYDDIVVGPPGEQHDWEIELAVIIGKKARRISRDDASDYIAGYTICNDISTRDLTFREDIPVLGADWLASKNRETYFPMGPYMTPKEFVQNPDDLHLKLSLNGEVKQEASTSEMIRSIGEQIEYISSITSLYPGDIVATGSPQGNGVYWGTFLKEGDVLTSSIDGIGEMQNKIAVDDNI